ncbi:MAG: hypothetical protein ABIS38_00550 [Sphingomicrobium sp.]
MIDQHFDRGYQHGRAALNRDLGNAAHSLATTIDGGLRALHRLEWSAPWARTAPPPQAR